MTDHRTANSTKERPAATRRRFLIEVRRAEREHRAGLTPLHDDIESLIDSLVLPPRPGKPG